MDGKCFAAHRQRVIDILKEKRLTHSVILVRSGKEEVEPYSEGDLPFYQEALFFWLTGWTEPDSALIIDVAANKSILLTRDYDDSYEVWTGPIPTNEEVIKQTGVDEVTTIIALDSVLEEIDETSHPLHRLLGFPESKPMKYDDTHTLPNVMSIARRIKFDWELKCLKHAAELTSDALLHVMKTVHPGMTEKSIEANFLHYGMCNGADGLCFPTIAASGSNASYLHYIRNSGIVKDNSLVLMDCGFFYNHYSGDVTRTFPANGKFTDVQKEMYNDVLDMQLCLIENVKPNTTVQELDELAAFLIFAILKKHNIVDKDAKIDFEITYIFLPHGVSHHIGCNNHDPCSSDVEVELKPGMVISMEPGIYFNKVSLENAQENDIKINYQAALQLCDLIGGIRIEDDLLITKSGCEIISTCPKKVEEIEKIMSDNK